MARTQEQGPQEGKMDRRQFLRGAAATGAGALLIPSFLRVGTAHAAPNPDLVINGGHFEITDLRGKVILSAPGIPDNIRGRGGLDLADHAPFTSPMRLASGANNVVMNVLAEPGSLLADRGIVERNEGAAAVAKWDTWVREGTAEYIQQVDGPRRNFWAMENTNGEGWSWAIDPDMGDHWNFDIDLPKHVIARLDMEEGWVFMNSANGDRDVMIDLYQSGANRGVDFGHHTLFIRTPYEQTSHLRLSMPTVPGTALQIFGKEVRNYPAFASVNAFLQGVDERQARADYPRYFVHTYNINDHSFGSMESPAQGAGFQTLGSNYR